MIREFVTQMEQADSELECSFFWWPWWGWGGHRHGGYHGGYHHGHHHGGCRYGRC